MERPIFTDSSSSSSASKSFLPPKKTVKKRPSTIVVKDLLVNMLLDIPKSKRSEHIRNIYKVFKIDLAGETQLQDKPPKLPKPTSILEDLRKSIGDNLLRPVDYYTKKELNKDIPALISEIEFLNTNMNASQKWNLYFGYCIGMYLHDFKSQRGIFLQMHHHFNWKKSWCYFLIQLYKLLEEYPKFKRTGKSVSYIQQHLSKINNELFLLSDSEKLFWKEDS